MKKDMANDWEQEVEAILQQGRAAYGLKEMIQDGTARKDGSVYVTETPDGGVRLVGVTVSKYRKERGKDNRVRLSDDAVIKKQRRVINRWLAKRGFIGCEPDGRCIPRDESETLNQRCDRIAQGILREKQDNGEQPVASIDEEARVLAAEAGMDVHNPLQWAILMAAIYYMGEHHNIDNEVARKMCAPSFEDFVRETRPVK